MSETRSMSDDELEMLQVQARKLTALDLKKQALAAKQSNHVGDALELLKQAKKIEQEGDDEEEEDEQPFSSTLPIFWKKVAILCKQAGDIDRAKQALMHSKALESGLEAEEEIQAEENGTEMPEPQSEPTSEPEPTEHVASGKSDAPPPTYENVGSFTPPSPPSYDNVLSKEDEEEEAMLAELIGGGEKSEKTIETVEAPATQSSANSNDDDSDSHASGGNEMTFTDNELMDEEMMTEFRLGGVKGIPTQEEYAAKVLAYKKLALKSKQEGDIPKATQNLRAAKQLEKVATALKNMEDGLGLRIHEDSHGWMETLNPEESDLLGELFAASPANNEAGGNEEDGKPTDRLTLDDLEDMDDDNDVIELVEMMGPDALPTVEEVTEKINEHKQQALQYKQEGNIELAKSSLLQSKKAKLHAMRLAEIYRKLEQRKSNGADHDGDGGNEQSISMEALESLVDGNKKPDEPAPKQSPPEPSKDPWLLKPSSEIKAEVIRLKNEKQVKEATRLLQLFKQKLAEEQRQVELVKCSKLTDTIQKRIDVSETQRRLWQYYQWFGTEPAVGCSQRKEWTEFEGECQKAVHFINTEGSDSVQLGPRGHETKRNEGCDGQSEDSKNKAVAKKLYMLEDDILSLVETCTNTGKSAASSNSSDDASTSNYLANNSLEVAIMGLFEMDKNEKLQKILSKQPKSKKADFDCPDLRISSKLQLPIHPEDPSKPVFMNFDPTGLSLKRRSSARVSGKVSALQFKYDFDPSSKSCRQQIGLPRKDPKQERILLRRMETKTIQLSVYYLHNQQKRQQAAARKEAAERKKSSWFFSRGGSEPQAVEDEAGEGDAKDIFLGKVTIELKQLLSRGCIAGDFPIMVNSKEIGGVLRVCLRTRPILDPDRYDGVPVVAVDGGSISPSIKTYKKGLAFVFSVAFDDLNSLFPRHNCICEVKLFIICSLQTKISIVVFQQKQP